MAKADEVDFRLAIGRPDGPRSSVWRGFSTNDEVYLSHGGMGKTYKFSFHSSCICRLAFTEIEGPADGETDRVMNKWRRASAPADGGLVYVLIARFYTDVLSTSLEAERKKVTWIPAADSGAATVLEFVFTKRDEHDVDKLARAAARSIVSYTRLPNGEAFVVTWTHERIRLEDFTVPGALFPDREYVISSDDPANTGRPARLTRYLDPTSERPMIAEEFGAYPVPIGTAFSKPMGTLTRKKVLKRRSEN